MLTPVYRTRYGHYLAIGGVRKKNDKTFLPFRSNENSTEIIILLYVMGILTRITTSEYALLFYFVMWFLIDKIGGEFNKFVELGA